MNSTETNTETSNPCQREVAVEIPAEVVSQEWQSTLQRLQKFARIPGFRRGKVPATIIRQRFADDIKSEIIEHLIPKYFREEAAKQNLTPVSQPQVKDLHLEEGEPLKFTASFEVLPEFEVSGYNDIKVEKETVTVTDEEVEKDLNHFREHQAAYDPVEEDRALVDGDFAQVSLKSTNPEDAAGKPVEMNDVLVEIGGTNTVKEFTENLAGAKVNDERSFDVPYPADFQDARLAGKTLHYEVKVTAIKKKSLPELNDDFAKQLNSEFNTIDDLRKRVREGMEAERNHQAETKAKDKIVDELIKKIEFAVPNSMVEHQIDQRLDRGLRALMQQGMKAEDMKRMDIRRLREGQREGALREVKASLLLEKIADAEKIEVGDEELDKEIQLIAQQARQAPEAIKARLKENGALEGMRDRLRNDKALDKLYRQS